MDRLVLFASHHVKDDFLLILWTHKHRITLIQGKKELGRGEYSYNFIHVQKYFIPGIHSWYSTTRSSHLRIKSLKFSKLPSKYLNYDGITFQPLPHYHAGLQYKNQKYYRILVEAMHNQEYMSKWLQDGSLRSQLAYQTLKFLAGSNINPNMASLADGGFKAATKSLIIKNWIAKRGSVKILVNNMEISMVRDAVGLYTVDQKTKECIKDVDCISAFDVEHIVSNSFGVDNSDVENGVLLDSVVNRKKGNNMLFLADEHVLRYIRVKHMEQEKYLRSIKPIFQRFF